MDPRFALLDRTRVSLVRPHAARPHPGRRLHRALAGAVVAGTLLLSISLPGSLAGAQALDSDADGLFDEDEIGYYLTDPALFDTDGDGFGDGEEVYYLSDPLDAASMPAARVDTDLDGLYDDDETAIYRTDPAKLDTDGDGIGDGEEVYNGTDPVVANGGGGGNPDPGNPDPGNPDPGNPDPGNPDPGNMGGATCLDAEEAVVLTRINQARAAQGLAPVQVSGPLNLAAERHSLDMGTRGFYDHVNPDGQGIGDRILAAGYAPGNPFKSAENIFAYQTLTAGADAYAGWEASPGHYGNFMNPEMVAIGIARVEVPGSPLGWYWTTTHANAFDVAPVC